MARLGTGHNEAFLYDKNGSRRIAKVENATNLRWTRNMNAISEASVTLLTGAHDSCCGIYGNIGTWGTSLVMFRDGVRSWEGPITNIIWGKGSVSLSAHDVLGWTMKKATDVGNLIETPVFVIDQLEGDLIKAFAAHDPNVLAHVTILGDGTGPTTGREVKPYGGYYDDQLNELVKAGGYYTTVGRKIIIWPSTTTIARLPTMFPTKYISGEVTVEEDGMAIATSVFGVNDSGEVGNASGNLGVHAYYGQLEHLVPFEAPPAMLATAAEQTRERMFPAPLSVNVPAGSVLSCDAPYAMEHLVCGSLMNVKIEDGLCKKVEATQQLTSVEVTQDATGEKVAITVEPVSGVLV